jgi:hypothetical protein
MFLLRLWGIGRETLVVVSVGGLMAAVALLPRVVGEPNGQHFVLSPIPGPKSTSVSAPTFPPPSPRRVHVQQHVVPGFASKAAAVSLIPAAIVRPQQRIAHAGRPLEAKPEPVAPAKSPLPSVPSTPAAPPSPAPQPAEIPAPTPVAPQPAITLPPAASAAVAVGLTVQSTTDVQSATNASTKNPKRGHPLHGKKHSEESSVAPIAALTTGAVAVSESFQVTPSPVADGAAQAPTQATHHEPQGGHGHKGGSGDAPAAPVMSSAQPDPTTVDGDPASASDSGVSLPTPAPPTPFNPGSNGHGHDDGVTGPPGHTKDR